MIASIDEGSEPACWPNHMVCQQSDGPHGAFAPAVTLHWGPAQTPRSGELTVLSCFKPLLIHVSSWEQAQERTSPTSYWAQFPNP